MTRASLVRACLLAALAAFVTLFVQILVHRVISAKLLNNYAFLVISLTMLGFAFSGAMLTRWLEPVLERWGDALTGFAAGFVLSLIGAAWLFYRTPGFHMIPPERLAFLAAFGRSMPLALLFTIPFIFVGLILGVLLSARKLPTPRVYFFDLAGSALGAFAVIPAIRHLGVELSLVLACGVLLLGTMALAPPRDLRIKGLAVTAALAVLLGGAFPERVFKMVYPPQSTVWLFEQFGPPYGVEHVAWEPRLANRGLSHPDTGPDRVRAPVTDRQQSDVPSALSAHAHAEQLRLYVRSGLRRPPRVLDRHRGDALRGRLSRDLRPRSPGGCDRRRGRLRRSHGALLRGVQDSSRRDQRRDHRDRDEHVRRVLPGVGSRIPGSSWLPAKAAITSPRSTSASTSSSSRASTPTAEPPAPPTCSPRATSTPKRRGTCTCRALTENGIICMMRLELHPPREMLRALTSAVAALRRDGVKHPAAHVMAVTETGFSMTALLVKKTPFTREEELRIAQWAEGNEYLMYAAGPSINHQDTNNYQRFLDKSDPKEEARFIASAPFDISPVPDDRPFFFKYSFWWHLWSDDPLLQKWAPVMELSHRAALRPRGARHLFLRRAAVALPLGSRGDGSGNPKVRNVLRRLRHRLHGHRDRAASEVRAVPRAPEPRAVGSAGCVARVERPGRSRLEPDDRAARQHSLRQLRAVLPCCWRCGPSSSPTYRRGLPGPSQRGSLSSSPSSCRSAFASGSSCLPGSSTSSTGPPPTRPGRGASTESSP